MDVTTIQFVENFVREWRALAPDLQELLIDNLLPEDRLLLAGMAYGQALPPMTASEAAFAIFGALTSSDTVRTFSSRHLATEGADVAERFMRVHGLAEPRQGWEALIVRGWMGK